MADQLTTITQLSVPRYAPRPNALPIPSARWNDEPLMCLEVNDEWVSHILGVMSAMDQQDTWKGDEDAIRDARQQVNEIMLAFMEVCMNCCDQPEIPLTRVDENGHYQQSTDGGTTWTDTPQFDPRNSIPRLPPNPAPDTTNAKCAYADSIVQLFKAGFVDVLEEGQTVEEVAGFLTSVMEAIFGPLTGPIGWIVPAIFAIATAIIAVSITAFEAAFNDTVWNALRCLIRDNIGDDGSFTVAQLDNVYSMIDTVATDVIAQTVLRSWIAAMGVTGMTNAAHSSHGNPDACGACTDCACDLSVWERVDDRTPNPTIDAGACTITQEATLLAGNYYSAIFAPEGTCCLVQFNVTSGDVNGAKLYWPCDTPGTPTFDEGTGWVSAGLTNPVNCRGWLLRSTVTFDNFFSF